ncbi:MAG: ABC transporter permease [Cyanobacteria bacterium P01_A01_bin.3]
MSNTTLTPFRGLGWVAKLLAFARKDLRVATSYRTDFLARNFFILSFTLLFYFAGNAIGGDDGVALLGGGNTEYFPFVIIGLAFLTFINTLVNDFPDTIKQAQTFGTLEPMLVTTTPIGLILAGNLAYPLIRSSLNVVSYLLLAVPLGVDMSNANVLSAIAIFIATIAAFGGLGALLGASVMVFKQNFGRFVLQTLFSLFGGVFFPIESLPPSVQWVASCIPLTPALEGMRLAILKGATPVELWQPLLHLLGFAAVLIPLGYLCFRAAVRVAQRDGTLTYR